MGRAFQCDLCGNLQAGGPSQELTIKPAAAVQSTAFQLCDGCALSFDDWRTDRVQIEDDDEAVTG